MALSEYRRKKAIARARQGEMDFFLLKEGGSLELSAVTDSLVRTQAEGEKETMAAERYFEEK